MSDQEIWNSQCQAEPVQICLDHREVTLPQVVAKLRELYEVDFYVHAWTSQGHVIVIRPRKDLANKVELAPIQP